MTIGRAYAHPMTVVRRLAVAAVSLLTAITATLFVASPAQAAFSDCPVDYFCIWPGYNASGTRWQFSKQQLINGTNNGIRLGFPISNDGSSFYNHLSGSGWDVNIYDSGNCHLWPWYRRMVSGQLASAGGSDWDNRVSSIQLWNASPLLC